MCGYVCIGFIDFIFEGKTLTEYTSLFSADSFKKNDDIILSHFKKWVKIILSKQLIKQT